MRLWPRSTAICRLRSNASLADCPHFGVDRPGSDGRRRGTVAATPTACNAVVNSSSSAVRTAASVIPSASSARSVGSSACCVKASRRCSASTVSAPSAAATSRARVTAARAELLKRSNIAVPSGVDPRGPQPGAVLLVDGLAGDVERLGHASPRPTLADRQFHVLVLEPVGELPQRHHGTQPVVRIDVAGQHGRRDRSACQQLSLTMRLTSTQVAEATDRLRVGGVANPPRDAGAWPR